jgi:hypothetical protein
VREFMICITLYMRKTCMYVCVCVDQCMCVFFFIRPSPLAKGIFIHGECVFL